MTMPNDERLRELVDSYEYLARAYLPEDPTESTRCAAVAAACRVVIEARALCDQIESGIASRATRSRRACCRYRRAPRHSRTEGVIIPDAPSPSPSLEDVIARAIIEARYMSLTGDQAKHIATAVAAHMLSDAVVERACIVAIDDFLPAIRITDDDKAAWMSAVRAAIRAALNRTGE